MRVKFLLICILVTHFSAPTQGWSETSLGSVQGESQFQLTQNCVPGVTPEARKRCDEAVANQLKATSQTSILDGGWRLVKTRDFNSGLETVSVMRTVDMSRSAPNFAGVSLRCSPTGIQVVLIVLSALPRTSQPTVTVTAGPDRSEFQASVIQRGDALLLPDAASKLAVGSWQKASELAIEINGESNSMRGIVPIGELSAAVRSLSAYCSVK